jgi:hypothetical protein
MQNDDRFIDSDLWKELVAKGDSVRDPVKQEAVKQLREGDLRDLVQRLKSDSPEEQYAALGVLSIAVRDKDSFPELLLDELRNRATELAKGWAIDKPLFDRDAIRRSGLDLFEMDRPPEVARRAYHLLTALDRELAAQFLVSHFAWEPLSSHGRCQVMRQLAELCSWDKSKCSDTALRRLIAIAEAGGPEGKEAAGYLIGRQLLRRSEVEKITQKWRDGPSDELSTAAVSEFIALHPQFAGREAVLMKEATDWRETKSAAALNRLYTSFFLSLSEGSPVGPLLVILGTPDWWSDPDPRAHSFSSDEGPALLVHVTTDGKLSGMDLK